MTEYKYVATMEICKAFDRANLNYTVSGEAGDDCVRLPIQIGCGPILTAELSVMGNDGHVIFRPIIMAHSIPDHVREIVLLFLNHLNMSYSGFKFYLDYDDSVMVCYDHVVSVLNETDDDFYVSYYEKLKQILNNEYLHLMQVIIMADNESKDLGMAELLPSDKRFRTFLWTFLHAAVEGKENEDFDNLLSD